MFFAVSNLKRHQ